MNIKKIAFYLVWFALLCIAPLSILHTTPPALILANKGTIVQGLQRLFGLWAFTLISVQIVLGAYMQKWTDKLGPWVFNFHIFEGVTIYLIIILHTFSFLFFNYLIGRGIDPYFVWINVCVICPSATDYYYTFGRIAFWLATIAVFAGLFRMEPFLRNNWRKFHILNYLVFIFVAVHSYFIGTDVSHSVFRFFYFIAISVVALIVGRKFKSLISYFR